MDSDFGEKLKNVLSDPEAMAKITAIASSLGMSPNTEPKEQSAPAVTPEPKKQEADIASAFSQLMPSSVSDPRIALLSSLKPLLREEKRDKIDALTRALSITSMMKNFRK